MPSGFWSVFLLLSLAACREVVSPSIDAPENLRFRLQPSGDPDMPSGVVLEWDAVPDADLSEYRVYSRPTSSGNFDRRGSTTSPTFHDAGVPDLDYYVTAVDDRNRESDESNVVRVDGNGLRLPRPDALSSVSLDGAIHLVWTDNAFAARPTGFRAYRLYSTSYDLDLDVCGASWVFEGTTVSPQFLATNLANGVPRCFAVSAESVEGFESVWSPVRADTPRPDARNVLVYAYEADPLRSGFRFWEDLNSDGSAAAGELGRVLDGNRTDVDFWVFRDVDDRVFLVPERAGTTLALYDDEPVADLTSIDVAPGIAAFSRTAIEAVPGYGYVFQMLPGGTFPRYGAIRVTHVSRDYLIFDWSFQTDPGNPELRVGGGVNLYQGGVTVVQE